MACDKKLDCTVFNVDQLYILREREASAYVRVGLQLTRLFCVSFAFGWAYSQVGLHSGGLITGILWYDQSHY